MSRRRPASQAHTHLLPHRRPRNNTIIDSSSWFRLIFLPPFNWKHVWRFAIRPQTSSDFFLILRQSSAKWRDHEQGGTHLLYRAHARKKIAPKFAPVSRQSTSFLFNFQGKISVNHQHRDDASLFNHKNIKLFPQCVSSRVSSIIINSLFRQQKTVRKKLLIMN